MNYLSKKSLRRLALMPVMVLVAGLVMVGCYEDYGLTVKDFDTYTTVYVPGTNFQSYKYFILPDTIMHIISAGIVDPIAAARKYDAQILSLTASNLQARGYTRLADSSQIPPGRSIDSVLMVRIGQFSVEYTGYYYDYWYGYWGGYYPYGGYYPGYVYTYDYTKGTNVTEIADFGKSVAQRKAVPVWVGIISGLTGESSTAQNRIATGINRTFEQSPYLYAGQ